MVIGQVEQIYGWHEHHINTCMWTPLYPPILLGFFVHFILSSRSLQYKHGIVCMHTIFKYNNLVGMCAKVFPFLFLLLVISNSWTLLIKWHHLQKVEVKSCSNWNDICVIGKFLMKCTTYWIYIFIKNICSFMVVNILIVWTQIVKKKVNQILRHYF